MSDPASLVIAFNKGVVARRVGRGIRDCPYVVPSLIDKWRAGWADEDQVLKEDSDD